MAHRDILPTRSDYVAFGVKRTFVGLIAESLLLVLGPAVRITTPVSC
jgi:hypothetical protein